MPAGAFEKGGAKLGQEKVIGADGSRERGIESAGIVNHRLSLTVWR